MDESAVQLGFQFANVVGRTPLDWISNKVTMAKETKKLEEQQNVYEDIINTLVQDKSELERIARKYKEEYERVTISDGDIEHLQNTIRNALEILESHNLINEEGLEAFKPIGALINQDTLKTMQLLGFNYKKAIGEPLTEVCASKISSLVDNKQNGLKKKK